MIHGHSVAGERTAYHRHRSGPGFRTRLEELWRRWCAGVFLPRRRSRRREVATQHVQALRALGHRAARGRVGIRCRHRGRERAVPVRLVDRLHRDSDRLSHRRGAAHPVDADFEKLRVSACDVRHHRPQSRESSAGRHARFVAVSWAARRQHPAPSAASAALAVHRAHGDCRRNGFAPLWRNRAWVLHLRPSRVRQPRRLHLDSVVKPLFLVVFALLVGAAVARSRSQKNFWYPH